MVSVMKTGYKQTEIGVIPEDWEVKNFGDVLKVRHGKSQHDVVVTDGEFPILATGGEIGRTNHYLYNKPSVLIGRKGTIDAPQYVEMPFWTIDTLFYTEIAEKTSTKFIFYKFQTINWRGYNEASGVPSLNASTIERINFANPPLPEQTAIAAALSDVDALMGELDKLIAKKRDIKQATMQQLLTGKKRLAGFSGEWEVKRLGDVAEIKDGTHQTPKYVESGIPFFSVENVTKNDFVNTKFISEAEHRLLTRSFKIEKGDILMTRIGSIGECKVVDWDFDASFYVSLALLKIKKGYFAEFIAHYSASEDFKKEADLHSLASAIPKKINLGAISNIRIFLPNFEEQTAIATILSDMDAEINALQQKREKTAQLKQGMMQELLTGRIRLNPQESTPC